MLRMAGIDGEFRFDKLMEDIGGQFFQNNRPDTAALGFVMTMGGAGIAQGAKKVNFGDRKKTICK